MKRFSLSPEARQDLRDIRQYYLKVADRRVARHVLEAIDRACQFIAGRPSAGHGRPDLTDAPVKFWQVFSYFIVYNPVPRPIEIVRFLHTSRDLETLLHERDPDGT